MRAPRSHCALRFFAGRRCRQRDFAVGLAEADRAGGVLLRIKATRHAVVLVGGGVGHFVHSGLQFLFHLTGVTRRADLRQLGGDAAARIVAVAQTGIHIHLHTVLNVFAAFNAQIAAHLALDAVGVDARAGETGVLAAVERHVARGDAGVGVGGFILLLHADFQTGAQRVGIFAGVRIDLAAGVLVEGLAAFGVGFDAQAPVVLMLLVFGGLQQDAAVFRLERGAAAADFGALQMQRVIAFAVGGQGDLAV